MSSEQPLPKIGKRPVMPLFFKRLGRHMGFRRWKSRERAVGNALRARMEDRAEEGMRKYGRPLETFNGRDPLRDLHEELMDAALYCEQERQERPFGYLLDRSELREVHRNIMDACLLIERLRAERDAMPKVDASGVLVR